ncbi:unnamed protein product [Effrenium voratum]|nr:unnamed protein product [Effrenium voratum]
MFMPIAYLCALHFAEAFAVPDLAAHPASPGEALQQLQQQSPLTEWGMQSMSAVPEMPLVQPNLKGTAIMRSLLAGLSTSLGAGIVLLLRGAPTSSQMAFALALAAGVMLTVSLVELFIPAFLHGQWMQAGLSGLAGFLSFVILRRLVSEPEMGCGKKDEDLSCDPEKGHSRDSAEPKARQWRLAFLMMLALTAHNFPEGLAVGVSSLQSEHLGVVVMAAIAVHNIPEGIAIAMPVLEATNDRSRAMLMATLSGLAEPLGALIAVTVLPPGALTGPGMDILLCVVGGIMTSVACLELVPEALAQRQSWSTFFGLLAGVLVMLLTHELA